MNREIKPSSRSYHQRQPGTCLGQIQHSEPPFGPGAARDDSDFVGVTYNPTWNLVEITNNMANTSIKESHAYAGPNNLLRHDTDVFVTVNEDTNIEGNEIC